MLAFITTFIWMKPRFKVFIDNGGRLFSSTSDTAFKPFYWARKRTSNPLPIVFILAIGLTGASALTMQHYVSDTTSKFRHLQSIDEIGRTPAARFYTANKYYANKNHPLTDFNVYTSGKNHTRLNLELRCLLPLYKMAADTNTECAWLAWEYKEDLHNPRNAVKEDSIKRAFIQKASAAYDNESFQHAIYFERLGNTGRRDGYRKILQSKSLLIGTPILTMSKTTFHQRLNEDLKWFLIAIAGTLIFGLIIVSVFKLKDDVLVYSTRG